MSREIGGWAYIIFLNIKYEYSGYHLNDALGDGFITINIIA